LKRRLIPGFLLFLVMLAFGPAAFSAGPPVNREVMKRALEEAREVEKRLKEALEKSLPEANREAREASGAFEHDGAAPRKGLRKLPSRNYALFISSSIPLDTLRNYARQAAGLKKSGVEVSFVLRGFVEGMSLVGPTIKWYLSFALKDPDNPPSSANPTLAGFNIDPMLARKAGAKAVPSLYDPDADCIAYGDAPLSTLIEAVREGRCGEYLGRTYAFAEIDALAEIEERARAMDWEGYAARTKERLTGEVKRRLSNLACLDMPHVSKTGSYTVVPSYELDFDVPDPNRAGHVLYPKGFRFNPLRYAGLDGSFLLIDADCPGQLKDLDRLLEQAPRPVRVLPIKGSYLDLAQKLKGRDVFVYASCRAVKVLVEKYGLCRGGTPCIISTEGDRFRVREISSHHSQDAALDRGGKL